jgi:hypothetical protein
MLQRHYADEYAERETEREEIEPPRVYNLPQGDIPVLVCSGIVPLPGTTHEMIISETRYLEMIVGVIHADRHFAVISQHGNSALGAVVEVVNV